MNFFSLAISLSLLFCSFHYAEDPDTSKLGSREGAPESIVANVSTIHGDYTEVEVDLTVAAPDSLVLSRFYSSRDTSKNASLGGWRFYPYCHLTMQTDSKATIVETAKGRFERMIAYVGTPEGSIVTYIGWKNISTPSTIAFKVGLQENIGLTNTARSSISCWTNLKNNELFYNPQNKTCELLLCTGGRRFYAQSSSLNEYVLTKEILPSGNILVYEYTKGRLSSIKEMNASEKKILAWIEIQYNKSVHIEASDGQTVDYQFQTDPSGLSLLTSVTRSNRPALQYSYQVEKDRAFLIRKMLPEGRCVEIAYCTETADKGKVRSITTPYTTRTQFTYKNFSTEVLGPINNKAVYRYDQEKRLVAIEQYLEGALYRIHKKSYGIGNNASNVVSTALEDSSGNTFYCKRLLYTANNGNIQQEQEFGDSTGTGAIPLNISQDGSVTNSQAHTTFYSYFTGENTQGVFQGTEQGSGVKTWYKKGTNLLIKKLVLTNASLTSAKAGSGIRKRYFYTYNEDAALSSVIVDDGSKSNLAKGTFFERTITRITPKQEVPNVGAPEIEEQIGVKSGEKEFLIKKTVHHFDSHGNVDSSEIYDSNGESRYTLHTEYARGLLLSETDPVGNITKYLYDDNGNLLSKEIPHASLCTAYTYDLNNRCIRIAETNQSGVRCETAYAYDAAGNLISEVDHLGNQTTLTYDSLCRLTGVAYPGKTYSYSYDLFDNQTSSTDPSGRTVTKSYTVHGKSAKIEYPDGTKEEFLYESGGNLTKHCSRDGFIELFSYDPMGNPSTVRRFARGNSGHSILRTEWEYEGNELVGLYEHDSVGNKILIQRFGRNGASIGYACTTKNYVYNAFHKKSETDENKQTTYYYYDGARRLACVTKENRQVEFLYDSLGRTRAVKTWKDLKNFTLEVKEYDLLDRVVEERVENSSGKVLVKKKYLYNAAGDLTQVIGYPQNQERVLLQYIYDPLGRPWQIIDAMGNTTQIFYDDFFVNEWRQKCCKRTAIDPLKNVTEELFDSEGNILLSVKKDASGTILSSSDTSYDRFGNRELEKSGVSQNQYETAWSWSQNNQLTSVFYGKNAPIGLEKRFEYNSYGELTTEYRSGSQKPISYYYNREGLLASLVYHENEKKIEYFLSYDEKGNLTKLSEGSPTQTFSLNLTYDAHDAPLVETIKDQFGSYQVSRSYDKDGLVWILQLPDGSSVEYEYDGPFVQKITRYSKEHDKLYTHGITSRDLMGNILEETLPGVLGKQRQLWDEAGRRIEISSDFLEDRIPEGGYDARHNIIQRELVLDGKSFTHEYAYDALDRLILEKGIHSYAYDSLGNRLCKDDYPYSLNEINQIVHSKGVSNTFDSRGNLSTETIEEAGRWAYQSDALNRLISVQDPDGNKTLFSYDLLGRRLSKHNEVADKKSGIMRFFYMGETELGAINEQGKITELKIPSDPNNPEAPCIAIELHEKIFVSLHDIQGNIAALFDLEQKKVVESYRYSAYGETEIFDDQGKPIDTSLVGNAWRYREKRTDPETNLVYFGHRYYDPRTGRWTSPDPLGPVDGPNLYAYVHNNPLKYIDNLGLRSEIDSNCRCIFHNHPGARNAPSNCCCICPTYPERSVTNSLGGGSINSTVATWHRTARSPGSISANDVRRALAGVGHGVVDFGIGMLHDFQTGAVYIGSSDLEMSFHERNLMLQTVEESQQNQRNFVGNALMGMMSIDAANEVYQAFRSGTTRGLEIGSLVVGGYQAVRGVVRIARAARITTGISKLSSIKVLRAESSYQRNLLTSHLYQLGEYGAAGSRQLPSGRIRYYGKISPPMTPGEMIGRRIVREWDPITGFKRTWHETLDASGTIRIVRPQINNGIKTHYLFDFNGNFEGTR